LPIFVDPSHGTGKRAYVPAMSLAALAAGADGLLIEAHPEPDKAMSDGAQSLDFNGLKTLLGSLRQMAGLLGRKMG
jgi:3-deoxy-7-phosphoheptulonate synthase